MFCQALNLSHRTNKRKLLGQNLTLAILLCRVSTHSTRPWLLGLLTYDHLKLTSGSGKHLHYLNKHCTIIVFGLKPAKKLSHFKFPTKLTSETNETSRAKLFTSSSSGSIDSKTTATIKQSLQIFCQLMSSYLRFNWTSSMLKNFFFVSWKLGKASTTFLTKLFCSVQKIKMLTQVDFEFEQDKFSFP